MTETLAGNSGVMAAIIGHSTWYKPHGAFRETHHEQYIYNLINVCIFTLLVYVTMLRFSEELECIWRKRFSLVTLFYILTRYGSLLRQVPSIGLGMNITSESRHFCNAFFHFTAFWYILVQVGIQGLLISRAYAVCRGSRFLAAIPIFSFVAGLILLVLDILPPYGCYTVFRLSAHRLLINLMFGISNILTNILVFGICTWSLWGTWKLKRQAGIGRRNDLVSIFFKQNILKCCFVTVSTIAEISVRAESIFLVILLSRIQISLLTIMVTNFTLGLRQRNSTAIDESSHTLSLSSLQCQSVLQSVHQSILVEMGTPEDIDAEEGDDGVANSAHVSESNAQE